MYKDAAWFVLVLLLGASLLAVMVVPEDAANEDAVENNDANCPDGTELALNASSSTGYDCVYPDPHSLAHTHPAPTLEVTNVVDDGNVIALSGTVTHLHPTELLVAMTFDGASQDTQPNEQGAWSMTLTTSRTGLLALHVLASHPTEETSSNTTLVEVSRTVPSTNGTGNETGNETNNSANETDGGQANISSFLAPGMHEFIIVQTVRGEEVNRSVFVHVPSFSDNQSSHPLLFGLHGSGGQPSQFVGGWLDDFVEDHGMVAVYPEGVERSWNLGKEASQADEFAFFDEVFSLLSTYTNLDSDQRFGVGISNGAGMLHTLGNHNDSFDGIVPIVTSLTTENQPDQNGSHPAILQLLGEDDGLVPVNGGTGVAGHEFLSANESLRTWALHNQCSEPPEQVVLDDGSHHAIYTDCVGGKTVEGYIVSGAGHSIPVNWNGGLKPLVWSFISSTMAATETNNGTDDPTGPTQPTYDPSDMGQFWLDVFRCQAGQNITQVDDLSTTAVETHECSVSITMNATHITITTNGLPDHDFESTLACTQANDCTRAQNYEWTIPRSPVNDTTGGHDATNCPEANGDYECAAALGEVAIAINGVPFYGPEDGPGGDAVASHHGVYNEDRQPIELGVCHAHNGQGGTFHYHADANCLHWHPEEGQTIFDYDISTPAAVAQNTANGFHSAVIGVSMDGYPIYGLWGYDDQMNVVEMKSSYKLKEGETGYNGIDDYVYVQGLGHLDVCNGHFGPTPEFPEGIYHYHSTMMNGEGDMGFPYFLLCYHGETFLDEGGGVDCSGLGETWGPGIGPPPPGCENEGGGPPPGGQLSEVQQVTVPMFSPVAMLWLVVFGLMFARSRWRR